MGYTRPASKNREPLKSVSGPDRTQASINGVLLSFTFSRAPFSVWTVNSYQPVSRGMSDPFQRIENSSIANLSASGLAAPKLKFTTVTKSDAITVPEDSVVTKGETHKVFVYADGKSTAREVETGATSGGRTEIVKGLDAGTKVLASPPK